MSSYPQTPSLHPPAPALWGASAALSTLTRGQDPRWGRCGAGRGAPAAHWSSDTRTWLSTPRGEPPCTAPWCQPAGQAPALQRCQLCRGAYASPTVPPVPPGAGAVVPGWRRGRQSPQLRAAHPSKHQSPSVLPAKCHRPALLVPRSPVTRLGSAVAGRRESKVHPWWCSLNGTNQTPPPGGLGAAPTPNIERMQLRGPAWCAQFLHSLLIFLFLTKQVRAPCVCLKINAGVCPKPPGSGNWHLLGNGSGRTPFP